MNKFASISNYLKKGDAGCFFIDNYNGDFLTKLVRFQSILWLKKHKVFGKTPFSIVNHCGFLYVTDESIMINHMTTHGIIIQPIIKYLQELYTKNFCGKIIFFVDQNKEHYDYIKSLKKDSVRYGYILALISGIKSLFRNPRFLFKTMNITPQELHFLQICYHLKSGGSCIEIQINKGHIKDIKKQEFIKTNLFS